MKTTFIVGGTHGTEKIGPKVISTLNGILGDREYVQYCIANPEALKQNIRFKETDLNRSFPGDPNGSFEEQIASKLYQTITQCDLVIDIHSTESGLKSAIILTNPTMDTLALVKHTNAKYVLIMDITKNDALISHAKIGIGFEYGKDATSKTHNDTVNGICLLLKAFGYPIEVNAQPTRTKKVFRVAEKIKKLEGYVAVKRIQNYQLVKKDQVYARLPGTDQVLTAPKDFYPILFNEPQYKDFFGFMGQEEPAIEDLLSSRYHAGSFSVEE